MGKSTDLLQIGAMKHVFGGKMKEKLVVFVLLIFCLEACSSARSPRPAPAKAEHKESKFTFEAIDRSDLLPTRKRKFKRDFDESLNILSKSVHSAIVLNAVREANEKTLLLPDAVVEERDQRWQKAKGEDEFITSITNVSCSEHLKELRERHPEFTEVLVTDRKGLNVCQTNKTTDYLQSDEKWWKKTFGKGKGHNWYEQLTYDRSAKTMGVALCVPVVDPDTDRVIGVSKAVLTKAVRVGS